MCDVVRFSLGPMVNLAVLPTHTPHFAVAATATTAAAAAVVIVVAVVVRTNVARFFFPLSTSPVKCLPSDSCVARMFPRLRSVLLTRQTLLFLYTFLSPHWWYVYCLRGNLNGPKFCNANKLKVIVLSISCICLINKRV